MAELHSTNSIQSRVPTFLNCSKQNMLQIWTASVCQTPYPSAKKASTYSKIKFIFNVHQYEETCQTDFFLLFSTASKQRGKLCLRQFSAEGSSLLSSPAVISTAQAFISSHAVTFCCQAISHVWFLQPEKLVHSAVCLSCAHLH